MSGCYCSLSGIILLTLMGEKITLSPGNPDTGVLFPNIKQSRLEAFSPPSQPPVPTALPQSPSPSFPASACSELNTPSNIPQGNQQHPQSSGDVTSKDGIPTSHELLNLLTKHSSPTAKTVLQIFSQLGHVTDLLKGLHQTVFVMYSAHLDTFTELKSRVP